MKALILKKKVVSDRGGKVFEEKALLIDDALVTYQNNKVDVILNVPAVGRVDILGFNVVKIVEHLPEKLMDLIHHLISAKKTEADIISRWGEEEASFVKYNLGLKELPEVEPAPKPVRQREKL